MCCTLIVNYKLVTRNTAVTVSHYRRPSHLHRTRVRCTADANSSIAERQSSKVTFLLGVHFPSAIAASARRRACAATHDGCSGTEDPPLPLPRPPLAGSLPTLPRPPRLPRPGALPGPMCGERPAFVPPLLERTPGALTFAALSGWLRRGGVARVPFAPRFCGRPREASAAASRDDPRVADGALWLAPCSSKSNRNPAGSVAKRATASRAACHAG